MEKINLNKLFNKRIYVQLNGEAINFIINLIKKSGLVLDDKVKENLYRLSKRHKISFVFLRKISYMLKIPLSYFYKHINLVTSVKNTNVGIKDPKLPFNFGTKEGARFIAAIMGDGEINNQIQVRYNNQDKKLIMLVLKSAKKIFGNVDYKIYYRKDKTYNLHFPKIIGLVMLELGLKPGYKSETNYQIPGFIFNKNKIIKSSFIRQFFNDEGNVRLKDRRIQVKQTTKINVSKEECVKNPNKYCHNVLKGIKRLFYSVGIESKINLNSHRKNKADFELSFYGKENLELFKKNIGFDLDYKNKGLNQSIKSYKFPSAPRNKRIEFAMKKFKHVDEREGFVTKYSLAKESKRSIKTAVYYLVDLKKERKITEIERPRDKKGYFLPRKYKAI